MAKSNRHFWAFEAFSSRYYQRNDGSVAEDGELHRFPTKSERGAWVDEPTLGACRRVVKTSSPPLGHPVRPSRLTEYIDHGEELADVSFEVRYPGEITEIRCDR